MQEESVDTDQAGEAGTDASSATHTSAPAQEDYAMQDPEFLESVLETLPGVDLNNEATQNAMGCLASQATKVGGEVRSESSQKVPPWHADYF